jgi:aryl-alcohol dehydrogenase-like predicted oxidoreductase
MKDTELGHTGELISSIGLGTMYLGTKVDEKTSFDIIDYYIGTGGRLLDSANKYASWIPGFNGGESESLIGRWLKKRGNRQGIFIISKVGFPYRAIPRSLKKEIIISECEKSLKRLDVETIDLYFAHAYDTETPIEETMDAFQNLKKQGKIRFAGASNFYAWQLLEANNSANIQGWEGFSCLQQRHTYLEPTLHADFGSQLLLTPEIQDFCIKQKICIMAYSPLLGGFYGKYNHAIPGYYKSMVNDLKLEKLRDIADSLNIHANAVVLAWMLQRSPQIIPIVGGSTVAQMRENFQVLSVRLTEKQIEYLNVNIVNTDS